MCRMRTLLVVLLASCLTSAAAMADPAIQNVSGDVGNRGAITITGTGFGTKGQAAPTKWDDFTNGDEGQVVTGWYTEATVSSYSPRYSRERVRTGGNQSVLQQFLRTDSFDQYNCTLGLVNQHIGQLYISGWFYNETTGAPSRNVKPLALRGGNPGHWDSPKARMDIYPYLGAGHIYTEDCEDGVKTTDSWSLGGSLASGAWHRFEVWFDRGTPNGNDGSYEIRRDLQLWAQTTGTFVKSDCYLTNVYFMSFFSTQQDGNLSTMKWFWDELYIDSTPARIEIGDASTWSACSHREIQIPSSWTSVQINATLNQGTLPGHTPLYLYVVDGNGNVNASGYPIEFGTTIERTDLPPVIEIQSPTSAQSYSTTEATILLAGSVSDDLGLQDLSWRNDRGGEGHISGLDPLASGWTFPSIPLLEGQNVITVTAVDTGDHSASDAITIDRTADAGAPTEPGQPHR